MKTFEWVYMDDGYGVVGVSFYCPHCNYLNQFVSDVYEEHVCQVCGKESIPEYDIEGYL